MSETDVLYVHGGMVYEPGLSAYETRRIAGQIPLERIEDSLARAEQRLRHTHDDVERLIYEEANDGR